MYAASLLLVAIGVERFAKCLHNEDMELVHCSGKVHFKLLQPPQLQGGISPT